MKNFMHFYEQIIKKILHMRMNVVDISHCLGHLIYKYYIILSFKIMDHMMGQMNKYVICTACYKKLRYTSLYKQSNH
jgi:hypothetical protein